MYKLRVLLLSLGLWMLCVESRAQSSLNMEEQVEECEKYLSKRKYLKAQECYEAALPFKPNDTKILVRLAEIYYHLQNEDKVKEFVGRAVDLQADEAYDPLIYLAQKMSFRKDHQLAVFILDKLGNNVRQANKKTKISSLKSSYLLKKFELNTPRYNVILENVGDSINSVESEYLPSLSLDGETMVFTRRVGGANEDFFISTKDSSGVWSKAVNMGYPPNTSFPDGAAKLSADGNYLFFTRCDMRSSNGLEGGGCDIAFCYKEKKEEKEVWSSPQYFGYTINTTAYEGQPCLSSDQKDLYFVSEREGGYGGKDIYISHFQNGLWSAPINLGPQINSSSDETAPFIHPDNQTLYFSSNGHPGLGSSDLFVSRKINDTLWQKALNLGQPINSENFDGSIVVNAKGTKGYLASERSNTKGKADIYSFDLYQGIKPISTLVVKGNVTEKINGKLIKEQEIQFYSWPNAQLLSDDISNKGDASFTHALHIGQSYLMEVVRAGYRPYYKILDLRKDTFPDNYIQPIRLREPGLIDTLSNERWRTDSASNWLDTSAITQLKLLKEKWPAWAADSAQIKIFIKTYHYYGDSDSDTLARVYLEDCLKRIDSLNQEFKKAEIPGNIIVLSVEPYIWREEEDDYSYIDISIVEYY